MHEVLMSVLNGPACLWVQCSAVEHRVKYCPELLLGGIEHVEVTIAWVCYVIKLWVSVDRVDY